MSTPKDDVVNLRVKGPALPVVRFPSAEGALSCEPIRVKEPALPVVNLTAEAPTTGEWVRLSRPALPVVRLTPEPPTPTPTVYFAFPLTAGADGEEQFRRLRSLIEKLNEMEALFDRAGVWVDGERSTVRGGEVVVVLVPNDPSDALVTCKRVADLLFAASRKEGVTVKVFVADEPETPVYELAA